MSDNLSISAVGLGLQVGRGVVSCLGQVTNPSHLFGFGLGKEVEAGSFCLRLTQLMYVSDLDCEKCKF